MTSALQSRLGAGAIGNQALPAVVLEVHVREVGVGRVGLDPGERHRLALALHVADRRKVDPGIGIETSTRLDLESDRSRVEVDRAQPLGKRPADRLGVRARPRGALRRVGPLGKQPAERVARRGIATADVDLPRCPAVPAAAQLVEQFTERCNCGAPDSGLGRVAAEVEVDPGEVDVGVECGLGRDRENVLGRDARLVPLDRLAHRFARGRHLRGFVESEQVGTEAKPDDRPALELAGDPAGAVELGGAVERDPDPEADRALEELRRLERAVQRDLPGWGAGPKGRFELPEAEDVAAGPLLGEDPAQGQPRVRLDRRQQEEVTRPAARELTREPPRVAP